MYQHILVPLDGSTLAEAALPAAAYFASVCRARVTLIHIIEQKASATVHGERHLTHTDEADAYLREVAGRVFPAHVKVDWHVHLEATRNVPRAIVAHQKELIPDLMIMAAHGQQGLREFVFGNIAQQVVAFGDIPLLLVHPNAEQSAMPYACDLILAPTDGEARHELGLMTAGKLAHITGAKLHLLSVVPTIRALSGRDATTQRFMPGSTALLLDLQEEERCTYLQHQVSRFQTQGIAISAEVRRGEPASVIAEVAETRSASLIVLGTHGKTGTEAFWHDSIGAKVVTHTKRPLLLVPVKTSSSE